MPILNADKAKNVIVIKRGQGAGFSGIENALFFLDNTRMLYGDGAEGRGGAGQRHQGRGLALKPWRMVAVLGERHLVEHAEQHGGEHEGHVQDHVPHDLIVGVPSAVLELILSRPA